MTVAVFGTGVAGMTAAHELAERGYEVSLYERNAIVGGKSRSFGKPGTGTQGRLDLPGEHGFRFFPGFYKHTPHTMSRIPVAGGNVAGRLVNVDLFSLMFNNNAPVTLPSNVGNIDTPHEFGVALAALTAFSGLGLDPLDSFFFAERMLCAAGASLVRRASEYETADWETFIRVNQRGPAYKRVFSDGLARPLVAMNPAETNSRTAVTIMLQIFQNIVMPNQTADRILNDPTSIAWIEPWSKHLTSLGVATHVNSNVVAINLTGSSISSVTVHVDGTPVDVVADYYIFALPFEKLSSLLTPAIIAAAPELANLAQLKNSWMTGLVFYFSGPNERDDGHVIFCDSPWALTSIWQLKYWQTVGTANIGNGKITGVLSTIISNWDVHGSGNGKKAKDCTLAELIAEVQFQLNQHYAHAPGGPIDFSRVVDVFLDPAISFNGGVVNGNDDPLLINTVGSFQFRPAPMTAIANMLLAGDYVQTGTNLATMEGACEAGRLAANHVLLSEGHTGSFPVIFPLEEPDIFDAPKFVDLLRFNWGMPQFCLSTAAQMASSAQKRGFPLSSPT